MTRHTLRILSIVLLVLFSPIKTYAAEEVEEWGVNNGGGGGTKQNGRGNGGGVGNNRQKKNGGKKNNGYSNTSNGYGGNKATTYSIAAVKGLTSTQFQSYGAAKDGGYGSRQPGGYSAAIGGTTGARTVGHNNGGYGAPVSGGYGNQGGGGYGKSLSVGDKKPFSSSSNNDKGARSVGHNDGGYGAPVSGGYGNQGGGGYGKSLSVDGDKNPFSSSSYNDKGCGAIYQNCCDGHKCEKGSVCKDGKCVQCGALDEQCCDELTCDRGLACGDDNQCKKCGLKDNICCSDRKCEKGMICDFKDACVNCGGEGEICCEDSTCQDGLACHGSMCVACGTHGERCCQGEGKQCSSPSLICIADTCETCGGKDEPCCQHGERQCTSSVGAGPLSCIAGTCVSCGGRDGPCCSGSDTPCASPMACISGTCTQCGGHGEPCCEDERKCVPSYDPCAYVGHEGLCAYSKSGSADYVDPGLTCVAGTCRPCGGFTEPCCGEGGEKCLPSFDPCDYDPRGKDCHGRKLDEEEEKGTGPNYVGYLAASDENRQPLTCTTGSCILCGGYGQPCCDGSGAACPKTYKIEKYVGNHRLLDEKEIEEFAKFEIHEVPLTCVAGSCEVCGVKGRPCCDVKAFESFSNVAVDSSQLYDKSAASLVIGSTSCLTPAGVCEAGTCTY